MIKYVLILALLINCISCTEDMLSSKLERLVKEAGDQKSNIVLRKMDCFDWHGYEESNSNFQIGKLSFSKGTKVKKCSIYKGVTLKEPIVINNIKFETGTILKFFEKNLSEAQLFENKIINNTQWFKGDRVNFSNEIIDSVESKNEKIYYNIEFPKGSSFYFEDHKIAKIKLSIDSSLKLIGHIWPEYSSFHFKKGELYEIKNGRSKTLFSNKFAPYTDFNIKNNKIVSVYLTKRHRIRDKVYPSKTLVKIKNGVLDVDNVILDYKEEKEIVKKELLSKVSLARDYYKPVNVFSNGCSLRIKLLKDYMFNGVLIPNGSEIVIDLHSGKITSADMTKKMSYLKKDFDSGTVFYFDKKGKVEAYRYTLKKSEKIQGILFPKGSKVKMDMNDKLENVTFDKELIISDVKYLKGKINLKNKKFDYLVLGQNHNLFEIDFLKGTGILTNYSGDELQKARVTSGQVLFDKTMKQEMLVEFDYKYSSETYEIKNTYTKDDPEFWWEESI